MFEAILLDERCGDVRRVPLDICPVDPLFRDCVLEASQLVWRVLVDW